jgi:hypothetical protein
MLAAYLPAEVWWCASLSGVRLSPHMASIAKKAGLRRGAPDFSFIFPDGVTRYVELKWVEGKLSDEQKMLKARLGRKMSVCYSWEDMRTTLTAWMSVYGLTWLTERESLQRYAAEREAKRNAMARPMRRRLALSNPG